MWRSWFAFAVSAAFTAAGPVAPAGAGPPNVVVILADDLGFSDLGCHAGEIETPHLDRLAAGGLRYTQGYNTARCWPTRAALLTGYYAQAVRRDGMNGVDGGVKRSRPPWARLLPELLAPAGYRSYHSGKWHVDGAPLDQGFCRSLDAAATGQNNYFDSAGVVGDPPQRPAADFYATRSIGDHAVACLAEHARDHAGQPFFHYVAFTAPHFPLHAPPELIAKYRGRYAAGWDAVREARLARVTSLGIVTTPPAAIERDVGPPYPSAEALTMLGPGEVDRPLEWSSLTARQQAFQAEKMAIYAAMIEALDIEVGRIVTQLEAMHAVDDTLVLFLSDNGGSAEIMVRGEGHDPAAPAGSRKSYLCLGPGWASVANAPFRRHKTWVHEGGIATPWIVHWPRGIPARGEWRHQPVHAVDVVPTLLEVAGLSFPREHAGAAVPPPHGRSFAASLTDPAVPPAHESLWWCHEGNRAVRVGDWKLVAVRDGPWELYDLAADRCETKDLARHDPARVAALEREWNRIAAECRTLATGSGPQPQKAAARPARARPNIVYVMTDDQGYGDIAAHGNPVIKTPHLDRLHAESVRLTEFHASPTCAPTRAALLTGRHEFRSGVTHTIHERERLSRAATTLPQLLRPAGYATGIFGKWHLGDEDDYQPGRRGFDRTFIHGGGGIGQTFPGSCGDVEGNRYFNPVIRSDGVFVTTQGYCTDVFFREACAWIEARHRAGEPFFCLLTPNAPHDPLDCPDGSEIAPQAALEAAGTVGPARREQLARFFGMIENIDANVGRLLATLDRLGIAGETLVVFTTDNGTAHGAAVCNDGMRGAKGTVWRGGTRVPSFWRWPGILPAGVDVPAVTAHLDVLPTLCEIAGAAIPPDVAAGVEGRSLVPLLHDRQAAWPDRPLVTHLGRWDRGQAAASRHRQCRIREGRWSLVNVKNAPDGWELHDVASDPAEADDVAAAHPDVVQRLAATYDAWWEDVQADLANEDRDGPPDNPFKVAYRRQRPAAEAAERRRPNIVLFLCDDLGLGNVSCLGSRQIKTPHIDALFARGTMLSRHWAGSAVCAPSRCVLFTGKHPGHAAVRSNREVKPEGQAPLPVGTATLASILQAAGYATGGFGKWGLGAPRGTSDPLACGFDRFYGYNCQREAHTYYPDHLWDDRDRVAVENPSLAGEATVARGGVLAPDPPPDDAAFAAFAGRRYSVDLIADQQLAFVRANAGRPFFLYVPTTLPHLALQVPADEPSLAAYRAQFGPEEPYLGGRGYVPNAHPLATYAAMITRMDREVGRLVALLEELDLADDTIFVFTSDNGAAVPGTGGIDTARLESNGPLRDWKASPYEGGLRVPAVAVWPGRIAAGARVDAPTGFEDWLPTLLDLAGLADRIPPGLDGVDLAPCLLGRGAAPEERTLYRELTEQAWQVAVDGRWKVIRRAANPQRPAEPGPVELYDLVADPAETTDVAAGRPDLVRRMLAILDREHVPDPDWPLPFADAEARPLAERSPEPRRTNILLIIADDQSPFDLKAYDPRTRLETPVLDRLAARGTVVEVACHMGSFSGAVCTPSRHMIMTGRSLWHLPIGPGDGGGASDGWMRRCPDDIEDHVLPAVFNAAGYDTMRTCKQGNSYEGADRRFVVRHDATKRAGSRGEGSGWHADRVLDFLAGRAAAGDTDPFLIHLGFSHPHDTRDGTPELLARYGATNHADPTRPPPRHPLQPPLPVDWLPRHPFDTTDLEVRDEVAVSGVWRRRDEATITNELGREYACSENIDLQIGRVLDRLAALGELEHTLVLYTSDHGIAIGRHGLMGKQNLYEHTWRVPLIAAGPGVKPGRRAPGNVYLTDILATLCDVAGIDPPASNEGTSFLPVLSGDRPHVREVLCGAYCGGAKPGIRSIRRGDWKLIRYESPAGGAATQLFDLADNPHELLAEHHGKMVTAAAKTAPRPTQRDLAGEPAQAAIRAELERLLLAEMARLDDPYRFSDQPAVQVGR